MIYFNRRKFASLTTTLLLLGATAFSGKTVRAAPQQARPADSFVETIGVGSRFDWIHNDKNLDKARAALASLGIRYIRVGYLPEGGDPVTYTAAVKKMALELNIKICLNFGWNSRGEMTESFNRWTSGVHPVYALEGVNEGFDRPGWGSKEWDNALQVQQHIWELGRAKHLDIYSWTLGGPAGFYWGMPREADKYSTHANCHPYHWYTNPAGRGNTKMNGLWQNTETPENGGLITTVRNAWMKNPTKPVVTTEFGWGLDTLPGNYKGVSETTQAKYLTRGLLENFNGGLERSIIYSLFPHNDDFGIARTNGSLRPSGQAIAALIALCGERVVGANRAVGSNRAAGNNRVGAAVTPGSLDFALSVDSGLKTEDNHDMRDDEIHHTLLQKRDKRFLLLLWADKDSQDGDKGAENATLRLAAGASRMRIFKPVTNGATPIATLGTVAPGGSVRLAGVTAIPDHPLVVEIVPAATP